MSTRWPILLFFLALDASAQSLPEGRIEGDIIVHPDSAFTSVVPARLWTNATVPYIVDPDIPTSSRITDAVTYYAQSTPVTFQQRSGETNYVHFVRSTVGNGVCSSSVGMIGGEQLIHVEDACSTGTLIHEMGHTVGFYHEQSRQDRNRYVTVLYENIDKSGYGNFNSLTPFTEQDIGQYDFASHMHYSTYEFSRSGAPVFQTVPAGIPVDSYTTLSPGDLDTLFRMYGKPPARTTVVTNPPGLAMTIDGQAMTSPQVFDWPAGSTHTLSVADQPGTNRRFVFGRWSDDGAQTHSIVSTPSITLYSANMIEQVQVTAAASTPGGTVALDSSSPDGYFATATILHMIATPAAGYVFLRWNGATCPRGNSENPALVTTATSNIACTASFTQSPVITIASDPPGLPVTVDGFTYTRGPVILAPTPGSVHSIGAVTPASNPVSPTRYIFMGWSDGGAMSHNLTAGSQSATVTASYKTQYSLVPVVIPSTVATLAISPVSADEFYDAGTQLNIKANAVAPYKFYQWTGDLAGPPCQHS